MPRVKKPYLQDDSFDAFLAQEMKDPAFARKYEALGPEFEIISQLIALRNKRKLTQAQLAKRVGTKQPSIARLEKQAQAGNLAFLQRVASALGARIEVRLVPHEASRSTRITSAPRSTPSRRKGARSLKAS
jgi:DNA-binding XRE family transcriptional regulator